MIPSRTPRRSPGSKSAHLPLSLPDLEADSSHGSNNGYRDSQTPLLAEIGPVWNSELASQRSRHMSPGLTFIGSVPFPEHLVIDQGNGIAWWAEVKFFSGTRGEVRDSHTVKLRN